MRKLILLWVIILLWSCSNNGNSQRLREDNIENTLDCVKSDKREEDKKGKIISIGSGTDDYFGKENFIIEDYIEEIDSVSYYSIKKINPSFIDRSIKMDKKSEEYIIVTENEDVVELKDISSFGDDKVSYEYIGFIPTIQSYLFSFISYEGRGNLIVSKKTGHKTLLKGKPYFSLDSKLFCVLRVDEEGETCGTIEFFDNSSLEKKIIYGLWSFQILPEDVCWSDKNIIYIKAFQVKDTERIIKYYKINIEDSSREISQDLVINKEYKITVESSLIGKNKIYINKGKNEIEIIKPVYKNGEEEIINECSLYILNGKDGNLIWIHGENIDSGLPNYSMLYDLKGTLLAYTYSVRKSAYDVQILSSKGNIDELLKQYDIENLDEQINNKNTPTLNIGIW